MWNPLLASGSFALMDAHPAVIRALVIGVGLGILLTPWRRRVWLAMRPRTFMRHDRG